LFPLTFFIVFTVLVAIFFTVRLIRANVV